jgi:hypothetical protein
MSCASKRSRIDAVAALPDDISVTVSAETVSADAVRAVSADAVVWGCSTKPPPQALRIESVSNETDNFVVLRFELILGIRIFDQITAFRFFWKAGTSRCVGSNRTHELAGKSRSICDSRPA